MLPALILTLAALGSALLRLMAYRSQMLAMARILEDTPAQSNLCLTVQMPGRAPRRLCRAVNARLEAARCLRLEALQRERELKHTMACISHDIRTPLAGAMGYLQLLDEEPGRSEEYLAIVRRRLAELEELLEQLFLYTRLQGRALPLECGEIPALPPLWDALAEFYPRLEAAGIRPRLEFDREDRTVWAGREALGRVYRNLISNAVRHGGGGLEVSLRGREVSFTNPLGPGPAPDPDRLFDRCYQSSPARSSGGAGLGLAIVRELMEQMGGQASAQIADGRLEIRLTFAPAPGEGP